MSDTDRDRVEAAWEAYAEATEMHARSERHAYYAGWLAAADAPPVPEVRRPYEAVRRFTQAILHGDDEHRAWLIEAAEAFIAGQSMPPPRDGGEPAPPPVPDREAVARAALGAMKYADGRTNSLAVADAVLALLPGEPVLPYDITIGSVQFRAGVRLTVLIHAAERWYARASATPPPPVPLDREAVSRAVRGVNRRLGCSDEPCPKHSEFCMCTRMTDAVLALLPVPEDVRRWRSIETAPREEGALILGFWPDLGEGHMEVARYCASRDQFRPDTVELENPTHWMPLPHPPGATASLGTRAPAAISDPIERIIAGALTAAGVRFSYEALRPSGRRLDFVLDNGVAIEVKQFASERTGAQMASEPNVILIQGRQAAEWFASVLLPAAPPPGPDLLARVCRLEDVLRSRPPVSERASGRLWEELEAGEAAREELRKRYPDDHRLAPGAPSPVPEWRSIETAPRKEGALILGFWPDLGEGHMEVARYCASRDQFFDSDAHCRASRHRRSPTHSMREADRQIALEAEVERLTRERDAWERYAKHARAEAKSLWDQGMRHVGEAVVARQRAEAAERERDEARAALEATEDETALANTDAAYELQNRANAAEARLARAREAIGEAIRQIEYLREKSRETGSGNGVLARLRAAALAAEGE
jgi:hypothetical protein